MKRTTQNLLILFYILSLVSLGVRSYFTEDTRFGWGMFRNQIDYRIQYFWVMESGERVPHRAGSELKRGGPRLISSTSNHRTRYGVGAVRTWMASYMEFVWNESPPQGSQSLEATLKYRVNRAGDRISETYHYPPRSEQP